MFSRTWRKINFSFFFRFSFFSPSLVLTYPLLSSTSPSYLFYLTASRKAFVRVRERRDPTPSVSIRNEKSVHGTGVVYG